MDKSAIEKIQEHTALQGFQASLDAAHTLSPLVAMPEGYLFTDLERYMPTRTRLKGVMKTSDLYSFGLYVSKHADEHSECFINRNAMAAKVIFDFGSKDAPLHCAHTCRLALLKTPAFETVQDAVGHRFSQKDLAEWLEDWRDYIQVLGHNGEDISLGLAIAAVRRLKIEQHTVSGHEVHATRSSRSVLDEIEASSDTGLPEAIAFTCTAYEGLGARTFVLRVSVIASHEKPQFSLRVVAMDNHLDDMAHEFSKMVETRLEGLSIVPVLGSFEA